VFFVAGKEAQAAKLAGEARTRVGEELNLIDKDRFELLLDRRLPVLRMERGREEDRFRAQPVLDAAGRAGGAEDAGSADDQGLSVRHGLQRLRDRLGLDPQPAPELMVKAFELTGLPRQDVEERFGGMYRAFQYGAPPHGGMAAGVDRIVMLLCGAQNLREITLFPMNQQAPKTC
jgi:aspartyl-tRNA synthetase